jgi:hypothetical protein
VAGFRNRRFLVEIIRPDKYMKIESKHFGWLKTSLLEEGLVLSFMVHAIPLHP